MRDETLLFIVLPALLAVAVKHAVLGALGDPVEVGLHLRPLGVPRRAEHFLDDTQTPQARRRDGPLAAPRTPLHDFHFTAALSAVEEDAETNASVLEAVRRERRSLAALTVREDRRRRARAAAKREVPDLRRLPRVLGPGVRRLDESDHLFDGDADHARPERGVHHAGVLGGVDRFRHF